MGTNFYADVIATGETFHLGERSSGWRFLFHAPANSWRSVRELTQWLETTPVRIYGDNGDGRNWNPVAFMRMATEWNADSGHLPSSADCWCGMDYDVHGPAYPKLLPFSWRDQEGHMFDSGEFS